MRCQAAVALALIPLLGASLVVVGWGSAAWALDPIPFVRTPDEQFENLPGYTFEPHYVTVDGDLRMHYVDTGPAHAPPILLLHGEPSWSYLYRKMIPPLAAAGYRVIAPDLIGFGRSDKPTNRSDYTYTRHVNWVEELLLALDLQQITLFCQDWGGLIGLRLVAMHPDRFSGVIAGNTHLAGGPQVTIGPPSHPRPPGPTFAEWLEYSQTVPVFDAGAIIQSATTSALSAAVVDAYRAPFPNNDETYLAGAREFPTLVGTDLSENQAAWVVLQNWAKPFLTSFSDGDRITWGKELVFIEHVPGAANEPHVIVQNAGHFLQEDKGEELANIMLDFLARNGSGPVAVPALSGLGQCMLALAVLAMGGVWLARRRVSLARQPPCGRR
jgi:haloalkane dehalogenase